MKAKNILIILWTAVTASILFLVFFTVLGGWGNLFWYFAAGYSLHISLAILAAAGAVFVHTRRIDSILTELNADDAARLVELHLRGIGYSVGSTDQKVIVLLDPSRNARIEVVQTAQGSELRVFPSLTPDGLGSMFSYSVILPFCGIVALWMSYRSDRMTAEFSMNVLRPTLSYLEGREKAKSKESEQQEIKSVITTTLKKANHLATEAFLALNASYSDWKWTIPLAGFMSYAALVFTMILTRNWNATWPDHYTFFLVFMLVATAVIVRLLLIWLRMRYRQESDEVNDSIGVLLAAISREEGMIKTQDGDEAALETLLNVCPDLPRWTKYRRRNFYLRNPGMASVIGWALFVIVMTGGAFAFFSLGLPVAIIFLGVLVALYIVTKWRNIRSDRRSLDQWRSRIGTLQEEMEKKLQEL